MYYDTDMYSAMISIYRKSIYCREYTVGLLNDVANH
jgi:hypothetical protein